MHIVTSTEFINQKNFHVKFFRTATNLNENNCTSRVWWALIEAISPRAKEMAGEKEMGCFVRGYHIYEHMWQ